LIRKMIERSECQMVVLPKTMNTTRKLEWMDVLQGESDHQEVVETDSVVDMVVDRVVGNVALGMNKRKKIVNHFY
jgi:hypothetical protein